MRILITLLLLASVASATITKVQSPAATTNSSSTTCNVTITANGTGAQRLLVFKEVSSPAVTLSTVTGGGTWTLCGANCRGTSSTGVTNMAYRNAPTASVTTVTGTLSASVAFLACWVEEYSTDQASFTVETISASNVVTYSGGTVCSSCASPSITITGSNDVISSIASCDGTCSGTITNWSVLYTFGEGSANRINTTSAAFNWGQGSSTGLATASIAFFDAAGGGVVRHRGSVIQSRTLMPRNRIQVRGVAFDGSQGGVSKALEYSSHPRNLLVGRDHNVGTRRGGTFQQSQPAFQSQRASEAEVRSLIADSATAPDEIKMRLRKFPELEDVVSFPTVRERFQSIVSVKPRVTLDKSAFGGSQITPHVERVSIPRANVQALPARHLLNSDCRQKRAHFALLDFGVLAVKQEFFGLMSVNQLQQV